MNTSSAMQNPGRHGGAPGFAMTPRVWVCAGSVGCRAIRELRMLYLADDPGAGNGKDEAKDLTPSEKRLLKAAVEAAAHPRSARGEEMISCTTSRPDRSRHPRGTGVGPNRDSVSTMAPPFTARQGEYLAFIERFTARRGYPPSFEEIGRHFGTTPPTVNTMIKTLERRGLLSRQPGVARSLKVMVPASALPDTEYGARARRAANREPSAVEAATTAARAVLRVLTPTLAQPGSPPVEEVARAVAEALLEAGCSEAQAADVFTRLGAQVAQDAPRPRKTR